MTEIKINPELLISLVENIPLIWDKTLEDYKDKTLRTAAWREVCISLKEDFEDMEELERQNYAKAVVKKWNQLRDTWSRSIKGIKKSISGSVNVKKYYYHNQMSFLKKVIRPRLTGVPRQRGRVTHPTDRPGDIDADADATPTPVASHAANSFNVKLRAMDKINVELMIPLVKERPVIWDKTLPVYRNQPLREKSWREVCALLRDDHKDLNKTQKHEFEKAVIKKWTQIRDSCCKYIKKRKSKKKPLSKPYRYFQELSFLQRVANIPFRGTSEENDHSDKESESEGRMSDEEEETDISNCAKTVFYCENEISNEGSSGIVIKEEKREDINPFQQNPYDVDDAMTKFLGSAHTPKHTEDDPNLHFFKGILPVVSTLNTDETLEFQSGVLQLLQTIRKQRHTQT